ncbi:MAG: crossover junction endodeoxyribonuclease RuvC [Candidatus Pacebacteria bacterium]|nr:crossover junction endodeoxyribonuclease RuvC [Candidatus Paceibacterota bacterium]
MTNPIIIGIDPGYDRLGWAVAQKNPGAWHIFDQGCIVTDRQEEIEQRFQQILDDLSAIIQRYQPQEAAVETLFWFKNQSSAMKVSEARGLIIANLLDAGIKISQYTPLQIKQAITGYGRADKKAVEKMVRLELAIDQNEAKNIIDDTFDALALVICHQASRKLKKI